MMWHDAMEHPDGCELLNQSRKDVLSGPYGQSFQEKEIQQNMTKAKAAPGIPETPPWMKSSGLFREKKASLAWPLLAEYEYPFEILLHLSAYIRCLGKTLPIALYEQAGEAVWIARSASVAQTAQITGPAIVCAETVLRPGAFLRGGVLVGEKCVVGNSTELKNCVLFDRVQVPHYNYIGDSVLGSRVHFGAGAVTSNLKNDQKPIAIAWSSSLDYDDTNEISVCSEKTVQMNNPCATQRGKSQTVARQTTDGGCLETGLRKCGAFLGDGVQVGCHAVLNPGCIIGYGTHIYPLSSVRGAVPPGVIVKSGGGQTICRMERD